MHAPSRAFGLALAAALISTALVGQEVGLDPTQTTWPIGTPPASGVVGASRSNPGAWELPGMSPLLPQAAERNRRKGALWGGAVGLVAGGILGGLSVGSGEDNGIIDEALVESAATGPAVVLGAVLGAGVGALLGATVFAPARPGDPAAAPGMALRVEPGGAGIGVGVRWTR